MVFHCHVMLHLSHSTMGAMQHMMHCDICHLKVARMQAGPGLVPSYQWRAVVAPACTFKTGCCFGKHVLCAAHTGGYRMQPASRSAVTLHLPLERCITDWHACSKFNCQPPGSCQDLRIACVAAQEQPAYNCGKQPHSQGVSPVDLSRRLCACQPTGSVIPW
jgi:hypothetical protein